MHKTGRTVSETQPTPDTFTCGDSCQVVTNTSCPLIAWLSLLPDITTHTHLRYLPAQNSNPRIYSTLRNSLRYYYIKTVKYPKPFSWWCLLRHSCVRCHILRNTSTFSDYPLIPNIWYRFATNISTSSSSQNTLCHTGDRDCLQVTLWLSIQPSAFILPIGDTWRHFKTETGDEITLYKPERWLDFMGNPRASLNTYLTLLQCNFSLFHETH